MTKSAIVINEISAYQQQNDNAHAKIQTIDEIDSNTTRNYIKL